MSVSRHWADISVPDTAPAVDDNLDRFDYPYMQLVTSIHDPVLSDHVCTDEGSSNRETGTYNVGGQVRSLRGGRVAKDEDLTDDLTRATAYQPDPSGLKGGVG